MNKSTEAISHRWRWFVGIGGLILLAIFVLPRAHQNDNQQREAVKVASIEAALDRAVVICDGDMIVEAFDQGAEKLFGVTRDKVVGVSMLWMIPPDMQPKHKEAWDRWWKSTDTTRQIIECTGADYAGQPLDLKIEIDPIYGADAKWRAVAHIERRREAVKKELP